MTDPARYAMAWGALYGAVTAVVIAL